MSDFRHISYSYVKRTYHVHPIVGRRVRHLETGRFGVIARENKSQAHHVRVRFDGDKHLSYSHPTALDYALAANAEEKA